MTIAGVGIVVIGIAVLVGRKHLLPVGLAAVGLALVVGWDTLLTAVLHVFGA